jgi:hypothetical protein
MTESRRTIRAFNKPEPHLCSPLRSRSAPPRSDTPGIAGADPNNGGGTNGSVEWDIGAYDFCMKNQPPLYTIEENLTTTGGAANRPAESGDPTATRRRQGKLARQPTPSGPRRLHRRTSRPPAP